MALDPVSGTLALFGTLITIVNVCTSTAESTRSRWDDFKQCSTNLESCKNILMLCHSKPKTWQQKWGFENGRLSEVHQGYWGKEGLDDIACRWRNLMLQADSVYEHIVGKRGPLNSNRQELGIDSMTYARWQEFCRQPTEQSYVGVHDRVIFALWGKKHIRTKILELRGDVNDLVKISESHCAELHGLNQDQSQKAKEAIAWRSSMEEFTTFMRGIHQTQQEAENVSWSLVLQIPSDEKHIKDCRHCIFCLRNKQFLFIHFVLQYRRQRHDQYDDKPSARAVTYQYKANNCDMPEQHCESNSPPLAFFKQPLFATQADRGMHREISAKILELRRASSALGSANWCLLLAETE
jgi:hypothetical protein